jgi:hypothetical protein
VSDLHFTSIDENQDPMLVAIHAFFGRRFYFIGSMLQASFRSNEEAAAAVAEIKRLAGIQPVENTNAQSASPNAVR